LTTVVNDSTSNAHFGLASTPVSLVLCVSFIQAGFLALSAY